MIQFSTSDNYDAPRTGLVMVRWPTPTQGQNIQIAQAGCLYVVSRNMFTMPATGRDGTFDVYQTSNPNECGGPLQDGCLWSAVSEATWIVVTTRMPVRGDSPVSFAVAPNSTGSTRTGAIRVKDKSVTIVQTGGTGYRESFSRH